MKTVNKSMFYKLCYLSCFITDSKQIMVCWLCSCNLKSKPLPPPSTQIAP